MSQKSFGLLLIGLGVGVFLGALFLVGSYWFGPILNSTVDSDDGSRAVGTVRENLAPDFSLINLDGETVELPQYLGKPVFLNFWATWCGPCREEMPLIQDYAEAYSSELVVLAINYDEPEKRIQDFADELDLTMPVLLDPGGNTTNLYRVSAFPTSFFIDSEGVIRAKHIGQLSETLLVSYLGEIGVSP